MDASFSSHFNLLLSPLSNLARNHYYNHRHLPSIPIPTHKNTSLPLTRSLNSSLSISGSNNDNGSGSGGNNGGGGDRSSDEPKSSNDPLDLNGFFFSEWIARISTDPQFLFKVLMEELISFSACMLSDMFARPNFGLNELNFVFSTHIVRSILNFTLMYFLALTTPSSGASVATAFPSCIFEPSSYALSSRIVTLVNKGATVATVGFAAGLVGTTITNGLVTLRKKLDPEFVSPNKLPLTLLNVMIWAFYKF